MNDDVVADRARNTYESVLDKILREWAESIRTHRPDRVAHAFSRDAVFQGSDPEHAVGRAAIAAYYQKRPVGLRPEYLVREIQGLGQAAFAAFLDVDFVWPNGEVNRTHLSLVIVEEDDWLIKQYHISTVKR